MVEPLKIDTPRRSRARGMGEILSAVEVLKDDQRLAERVREIAERVRCEEAAWRAKLDANGAPLKVL